MNKLIEILENGDTIHPVIPDKEKFLIKWDIEKSHKENIQNAMRNDSRIEESMRGFNLLYGGYSMEIQFMPKVNIPGFKRYPLIIGKPVYEIEGDD